MYSSMLSSLKLLSTKSIKISQYRNAQVSIIGAGNGVGSNLALMLKRNNDISKLILYDDTEKVLSLDSDLSEVPGGPKVRSYCGRSFLPAAIRSSHLILLVSRIPRRPGYSRDQMLAANAPVVQRICKTMADVNPDAILAISTNPVNSLVPFASCLLFKYCAYDSAKIFGITEIDSYRAKAYVAQTLNVNPRHLHIPVIGGHSDETIVPLFSNITPTHYKLDVGQADTLTKLVRISGMDVIRKKKGTDSSTLAMAASINEFVENMIEALYGSFTIVNSLTSNPHFGTRFFSGPTKIGHYGIVETCGPHFNMSEYERHILGKAISNLNREVVLGEEYARMEEDKTAL